VTSDFAIGFIIAPSIFRLLITFFPLEATTTTSSACKGGGKGIMSGHKEGVIILQSNWISNMNDVKSGLTINFRPSVPYILLHLVHKD
jgi:hypothetical protein